MKNYIFVFTGTGNSLYLATELGTAIGNTEILPIQAGINAPEMYDAASIGIIFPVFFMDAPGLVKTFLSQLPQTIPAAAFIYAVATCGRHSGNALASIKQLLQTKDYRLDFAMPFIMADSIPFPEFIKMSPNTRRKQEQRYQSQFKRLSAAITSRKHRIIPPKLPPITLFTKIRSRNINNFDQNFTITNTCISCGICVKVCGADNISIANDDDYPQFHHNCAACMACYNYCPRDAISYKGKNQAWFQYTNPNLKLTARLDFYEK